jgi:hypothetical protein
MTNNPRVFVIHESTVVDKAGTVTGDKNLSPATVFGDIVRILPPGRPPGDPTWAVEQIEDALDNITVDDYLIMIGAPEWIAVAGAVAARQTGGILRLLKWNRDERCYSPMVLTVPWGQHECSD